ncbi:MAG: Nramp family divalent metal transporter [Plesiomonas sp.]|uniref:Nramp family divalent metal transporter n=1 Tax=Plesiomonas sp. TaxID=2486279 RepID=UPI003F2CB10D
MENGRITVTKNRHPRFALTLMGPAFITAIGYIDPGNFATNIQAGSAYGYTLLWVVVASSLMAMLIQLLSAKLGIATHKNLAEHLRDKLPKVCVWGYWIQAEIMAMATDLAEFIGASIGFKLLLGISLLEGALLTAVISSAILLVQSRNPKYLEIVIGAFLLFVAVAYLIELKFAHPNWVLVAKDSFWPNEPNNNAIYLSAGILGATIMPHVIYLHSALTQRQGADCMTTDCAHQQRLYYRSTRLDVAVAMTIAGFVNMAMVIMAAATFHLNGHPEIADLTTAYSTLTPLLGKAAATIFALSLIASGLSSTVVGTLAGQVVMKGFTHLKIPLWVRRSITMLPAFIVIIVGLNPSSILVLSQVVLSFGIAFALIPLLIFTSQRALMGGLTNSKIIQGIGAVIVVLVVSLNIFLLTTA